jgi:predicted Zn-dependent protease
LPGGKIAMNRGLLMELNGEAELAAVLGYEVVHADSRRPLNGPSAVVGSLVPRAG